MTEQMKKKWTSMDTKLRMVIILALCLALLMVPLIAFAGSGISFSYYSPKNGTIVSNPTPHIYVTATASQGVIPNEHVKMFVDSNQVDPKLTQTENKTTAFYTPTEKLAEGTHSVKVEVYDELKGSSETTSWSLNVDAVPNPTSWSPAKNSTVTSSNQTIKLYVKDIADYLDSSSYSMTLDGKPVLADFSYMKYDDYGVIYTEKKEGIVSFNATNLSDETHTVEVSVQDVGGNVLTEKWAFTVAEKPEISDLTPADKSEQDSVSKISATLSDNSEINWDSLKLTVNKETVTPNFDSSTGILNYDHTFADGLHSATVEVQDTKNNVSSKSWDFTVDSKPPSAITTFQNGTLISDGNLKFDVKLTDLLDIKDNSTLKIDGTTVNFDFRYEGVQEYDGYRVTSKKTAYLTYQGTATNGDHTIELTAEDKLGHILTKSWTFKVSSKPEITQETPNKYGITDLTPTISATAKSPNGTIDENNIELKLDGTKVIPNFDSETGKISYTPAKSLTNESMHSVSLVVYDKTGLSESKEWKFYSSTYQDMADSNITNCTTCHGLNGSPDSLWPFEQMHAKKLSFDYSHRDEGQCANCHNYISYGVDCNLCHYDTSAAKTSHGFTETIKYNPKNSETSFPLRVTENREVWDCIICHQPGAGTKGYTTGEATPTRLLNNHDIPGLHNTTTPNYDNCTKCHAKSMTREHARDGRVDINGNPITCKTCHESKDAKITSAITNKDKTCSACHENASHEELHTYEPLNQNCTTSNCHSKVLSIEHDKPEKGLSCDTCHASTKQNVKLAITWGQKSCSDCHSGEKHGIRFGPTVPESLKYSSSSNALNWMNPESIDYWLGESWIPEDMTGGVITVSERRENLSGTDVFNYYKTELSDLGWTKHSGPDSGSDKFELIYTKGKAKVIIRFYDSEHYDSSSLFGSSYGYRIEIFYKN